MKFLILALLSFNIFAQLDETKMKFTYRSYDGQTNYVCDHKLVNDLAHIWDLYCFDENNQLKKKFSATVWVSKYSRDRSPENTYELIYRVTQRISSTQIKHTGSTNWINLEKNSPLASLTLSQSIEDDTAGLYLEIKY